MPPDRLAQNRVIFREVNDRLLELSLRQDLVPWTERTRYFCECGTPACPETLELTLAEYEGVRSGEDSFVVVPAHAPARTLIVEETERYVVVERSTSPG